MKKQPRVISIQGASEHNLKAVHVEIPHYCLTVVTGVSGSGKSSLVFDTLYREAERRYIESFSTFARQFMAKMTRPAVHHLTGLSPAIAVKQEPAARNPRSTVGTMSELYDYLRLLFARLGKAGQLISTVKLARRLFSFNSPYGACPACKGLGVEDRIDLGKLVENPGKTLRQGALSITTPAGYIIYSQVTMDVLNQVCQAHGFNVDIPWKDLNDEQKRVILYGSDRVLIPYGKHSLQSRLKWSGITAKPREEGYYKGILPVMENILRVDRNKNILRFTSTGPCQSCHGTRLCPGALAVTFRQATIAELASQSIEKLVRFFKGLEFSPREVVTGEIIRYEFIKRAELLIELGLGYLTLDRESTTLSGGEAQRIRLSTQVSSDLRGILYVLDEPSIGLHQHDSLRLLTLLKKLRDNGNTVVVVEHDEEIIQQADFIIDMGPGAGVHGGEILFQGPAHKRLTPPSFNHPPLYPGKSFPGGAGGRLFQKSHPAHLLEIKGAAKHNLKNIDVVFHLHALNVVTGVSGAGKSTLVHDILAQYFRKKFHQASLEPGVYKEITGSEWIDKLIEIDQSPIGRTPRSNPATYTKLFDPIRDLFASLPAAKNRGWSKSRFSFNVPGGRCESCEGAGYQQIGMHFLGPVDIVCDQCGGRRFSEETLQICFNGKNIYDVLEMSVEEALVFFNDQGPIKRVLNSLNQLGLGYITLGQSATTLSGGEAQRVKLAAELSRPSTGNTLYILDEPTTGLHASDIDILLLSLASLVEKGNTVIMVEHHPAVMRVADWLVDLGPGSGESGGECVVMGPPGKVAQSQRSLTGAVLRKFFNPLSHPPEPDSTIPSPPQTRFQPVDFSSPICLKGVSTHNLKSIDVTIPVNQLTVITGVSGSGKSSLAFDTLFAEGQQRFLSHLSTYARQMVGSPFSQAEIESAAGLMPTVAIRQKPGMPNPRSTVGTMTEIYDYYRLLFARAGEAHCPAGHGVLVNHTCPVCAFKGHDLLTARMFSFNHHQGACPVCKGLGTHTACAPGKLVTHPDRSLLNGALAGTKTGQFYGDPYGQYIAILKAVGDHQGIDFSQPWNQLDGPAQAIALYGTDTQKYQVIWKYKRKNRQGEHRFESVWKGFVNYVNEEYQRKHADKRGLAMLPLMGENSCPACHGKRLKPEFLAVYFHGLSLVQLSQKTVVESIRFFKEINEASRHSQESWVLITQELRHEIQRRLEFLSQAGLDYLSLDRGSVTLSGGEAQRIRLAGQLGAGLTGTTFILDEPTIGLHPRDTQRLLRVIKNLRDTGNTVVIVEHDREVILAADHIIELGPGGGKEGGWIIASGEVKEIQANENSLTRAYLLNKTHGDQPKYRPTLSPGLEIKGACANNLKNIDISIPRGGIITITGVSGSGKTSLIFDVIDLSARSHTAAGCQQITGLEKFDSIVAVSQEGIGTNPASTPATYTGIFDDIRGCFARVQLAQSRHYNKNRFSFNSGEGRCPVCQGMGMVKISMDFFADAWTVCQECKGRRYHVETLEVLYQGKSIADVLEMTICEARQFFPPDELVSIHHALQLLEEIGLGYIQLGQPSHTLSGGESQRLKLAADLLKSKGHHHLYLIDEPTTGLHFRDIERLLCLFDRLVNQGHTLLVIEHHPLVIQHADWIIDLGPGGGDHGGQVVAQGTPEQVAQVENSETARYCLNC